MSGRAMTLLLKLAYSYVLSCPHGRRDIGKERVTTMDSNQLPVAAVRRRRSLLIEGASCTDLAGNATDCRWKGGSPPDYVDNETEAHLQLEGLRARVFFEDGESLVLPE